MRSMDFAVTVHRPLYREAFSCRKHENPETASAIWGRMLHICASRSVLLDTESTVSLRMISEVVDDWADIVSLGEVGYTGREKGRLE